MPLDALLSPKPYAVMDKTWLVPPPLSQNPERSMKKLLPGAGPPSTTVPSIAGRSERGAQAKTCNCGQVRFNGPGSGTSGSTVCWKKVLLALWSTVLAVLFTTTKPAPVGPEWPHMEP